MHTPLESKPGLTRKYEAKAAALPDTGPPPFLPEGETGTTKQRQDHSVYAGMVESLDDSVGQVLDALVRLGLERRTIVLFSHVELYDVETDPGERTDLSAARPGVVEALRARLGQWRAAVGAGMPTPNPAWRERRR